MKRVQYLGIAGFIILIFGAALSILLLEDQYNAIKLHLILSAGLLLLFFVRGGLHTLRSAAVMRSASVGLSFTLYSGLFIGLLALVNYIASRHDFLRYDSTEQKVYSLAPQTGKVITSLPQPVEARAFYLNGQVDPVVKNTLDRMERLSDKFHWKAFDPEKHPELIKALDVGDQGGQALERMKPIVEFSLGEKSPKTTKIIGEISEEAIVKSILKLTRTDVRHVYFLTGHGERDINGKGEGGLSDLEKAIEDENIKVDELRLGESDKIPDNANAIVIAAPTRSLLPVQINIISDYLTKRHGSAILLAEPSATAVPAEGKPADDGAAKPAVNVIAQLAKPFGIDVGNDVVIDQTVRLFEGPTLGVQPVVRTYGAHPITEDFGVRETVFSTACSVQVKAVDPEHEENKIHGRATELAYTSKSSWAEKKLGLVFGKDAEAQLDPEDIKGPVSIAAAYEEAPEKESSDKEKSDKDKPAPLTRVVVVGDVDWISNSNLGLVYNRDLFLNMVNFVVGDDQGVTIRPRTVRKSMKIITNEQFSGIFLFGAILLPEALLLFGFAVWHFRKA